MPDFSLLLGSPPVESEGEQELPGFLSGICVDLDGYRKDKGASSEGL